MQKGFQLLELSIVLLLVGLSAGLAVQGFVGITDHYDLEVARRQFVSDLSKARALSMSRNLAIEVLVNPNSSGYALHPAKGASSPMWTSLPEGVAISASPSLPVTFRSRGSVSPAGSYTLLGSAGEIRVIVAVSGRIRWYWNNK
jgi:type II secretory pathway pseudopilin PulG